MHPVLVRFLELDFAVVVVVMVVVVMVVVAVLVCDGNEGPAMVYVDLKVATRWLWCRCCICLVVCGDGSEGQAVKSYTHVTCGELKMNGARDQILSPPHKEWHK